ncbi:MAG: hypothetical protein K0Q59_1715 [Paenibacillus sp.]|jgi:DUF1680 family protein|nr:hypothetical protein [Paenibacillus sp.]
MIAYRIENRLHPPMLNETRFNGAIGERLELFFRERITSDHGKNTVYKEAEDAFLHCVDDANAPVGIWQGEYWGKWMISACRVCRYNGDEELKAFIRQGVQKLMGYQREDGYIGTYRNAEHIFQPSYEEGKRAVGWNCDWNWNIWCRKYTLWGMLECYELLGDPGILEAAARSADHLIDMLERMRAHICETGTFYGVASGSILKPLLILYRHTENAKYLDFALTIADAWENEQTVCAKLIRKANQGMPPHLWNDWIDNPNRHYGITGKVYETISCFDGLLELYRITGEPNYLQASVAFFNLLIKYEYNALFSIGFNDLFLHAASQQHAISEPCDVIHFIRLAAELYKLTGEQRYIDFIELAFYNPMLASVNRDGKWGARGVRAMERHLYAKVQAGFTHNHCCVNNMPRGLLNTAEMIALCNADSIYINLYSEADVTLHPSGGEAVSIRIGEGYLQYGKTEIDVEAKLNGAKKLYLRVPSWSAHTIVRVDGTKYAAKPGEYIEVSIASGQSRMKIGISFDQTPRLAESRHDMNFNPLTPYLKKRYMTPDIHEELLFREPKATLSAGPILLSMSKEVGCTKEDMFDRPSIHGKGYACSITPKPSAAVRCGFEVTFEKDGESFAVSMCDYASASDLMDGEDYYFSIFL